MRKCKLTLHQKAKDDNPMRLLLKAFDNELDMCLEARDRNRRLRCLPDIIFGIGESSRKIKPMPQRANVDRRQWYGNYR